MVVHDCVGGLAPDMDIADAVRVGFVKCHEAMPLERFREAVLAVFPVDEAREKLKPLPDRAEFDVRRCSGVRISFAKNRGSLASYSTIAQSQSRHSASLQCPASAP